MMGLFRGGLQGTRSVSPESTLAMAAVLVTVLLLMKHHDQGDL